VFTVERVDADNNPVNWSATVQIAIDINKTSPTVVDAVVTGNQAAVTIPSTVCDQVKNATNWRLTMTAAGVTTALAVGGFERDDGA
jgi:hypothetical protein